MNSQIDCALDGGQSLKADLLLTLAAAHQLERLSEGRIGNYQHVGRDDW